LPDGIGIFKPKITKWVNIVVSYKERCWQILWPFGLFYSHMEYSMAIWPILQPYGIFYGHLVYFTAIWNILWPFGYILEGHGILDTVGRHLYVVAIGSILQPFDMFRGHFVYFAVILEFFSRFDMLYQ
jgi:hypothetical protein